MKGLSRSAATSSRRLLVLAAVAAVCTLGLIQPAAFAAVSPPPQPLNLNDQSNANNTITLTWTPTPTATSYNLYRGTTSGGEGTTPIATTTGTTYTDSGLAANTGYFYEVAAVNSGGESPLSAEDPSHSTPPTPTGGTTPGVASGNSLVFYAKDGLLNGFQWFEALTGWFPQVLGSSGANSPGHVAVDMAYAPTATLTFNDVVEPTAGLYTVDWRYAFASGLFPGVTNRQMGLMVNGTVITDTERFPITGNFETYEDSTIQVHLNAGTNSIQMFAVDDHGVSRVDEMTVTPATASVPSGPTNLTSTSGTGSVTLHWTASTSGSPTSYSIYRGTQSDGEATTPVGTVSGTTTTFTDTGLTNASSYYYVVAANNAAGVSPDSNEIIATPGVTLPSGTNLALNAPTYASSIQGAGDPASAATDDSFNTRWSSAYSDPQWLLVDLGATHTISQVVLAWESAYAKAFQIQVSNDAENWTTIYSTTTGTGGTQTLSVSGSGRYIRMYGTVRATGYGYSLWEFQVFGSGGSTGNTVTVTTPPSQTSTVGTAASLQVQASDSASGQTLTYTATGLPAGLSINSSSGLISGTPTTAGTSTVTVTATDTTGASGSATFTWTVSSGSGSGGVDISAGGPAAAPFVADEDFTGGATAATTHAITTTGLTNPAPQSVYQHNRYGNFTYTIPGLTAGASYTVRLHFAEEYWTTAGSRTFNVLINGTQVLTNFDIFATAGGEYIGVIEPFTATASSTGTITIQFVTVKDNAQVNGIEIYPSGT